MCNYKSTGAYGRVLVNVRTFHEDVRYGIITSKRKCTVTANTNTL